MADVHTVAVFCGASVGTDPAHRAAAAAFGTGLAKAGMRLVYGGGRIGLMGALADAAAQAGGTVVGVIPDFLMRREIANESIPDLVVTTTMHDRKRHMFDLADAFAVLPGGLGTMDETFEILTWRQLGLHDKPILFCDVAGSARPLVGLIEAAIAAGFARSDVRRLYEVTEGVEATLARLAHLATARGGASALL
jgi:uncharacterized protein (TIGR00730 family)